MTWVAASLMIVLLWIFLRPKEKPKNRYPTIEDIRRKYPKRLSQEQLRRQTRENNLGKVKNYDRGHGVRREPIKQRDISVAKFRQLVKMVNGQEVVARRLIEGNLKLFPDKSPDWACDKAISDLERDRR